MTAKMKTMIAKTIVKLPKAPKVRPIIPMRRFNVGQDLASLKTRSYKQKIIKND